MVWPSRPQLGHAPTTWAVSIGSGAPRVIWVRWPRAPSSSWRKGGVSRDSAIEDGSPVEDEGVYGTFGGRGKLHTFVRGCEPRSKAWSSASGGGPGREVVDGNRDAPAVGVAEVARRRGLGLDGCSARAQGL